MKIQFVSDLHLEFSDVDIPNADGADVLVLAGDITVAADLDRHPDVERKMHLLPKLGPRQQSALRYRGFLDRCSQQFEHVLYVAGNHEFYNGSWTHTIEVLRGECKHWPNIHFMEQDSVTIDGVTFVGSTLWTSLGNRDPLTAMVVKESMNDYRAIRDETYKRITPAHTFKRHLQSLRHANDAIADAPGDVVMVTHHLPSFQSVDDRFANSPINHAYASDLWPFVDARPKIKLWIHGHSHTAVDYMMGSTRVVCNPRGYVVNNTAEVTGWNPSNTVTL